MRHIEVRDEKTDEFICNLWNVHILPRKGDRIDVDQEACTGSFSVERVTHKASGTNTDPIVYVWPRFTYP